jgi:hypothetical protein
VATGADEDAEEEVDFGEEVVAGVVGAAVAFAVVVVGCTVVVATAVVPAGARASVTTPVAPSAATPAAVLSARTRRRTRLR